VKRCILVPLSSLIVSFQDFCDWPEFHNGCAAGLRLLPALSENGNGGNIHRTWIVYNRPSEPTFSHAGMLMGLGLQGHLTALAKSDLYW
jgi:anaphase-promoting complex subunit 1